MLLYFVRHGQTDHNVNGIIQGQLDTRLNDFGRGEAVRVAEYLHDVPFGEIWTSSLSRASETAQIIANRQEKQLTLRSDPGLMERYFGAKQGTMLKRGETLPHDVETSKAFRNRIFDWFTQFLEAHAPDPHSAEEEDARTILVVSHGAYMTALLELLLSPDWIDFAMGDNVDTRLPCRNTSFMRVRCEFSSTQSFGATQNASSAGIHGEGSYQSRIPGWRGKVLSWGEIPHLQIKSTASSWGNGKDSAGLADIMKE